MWYLRRSYAAPPKDAYDLTAELEDTPDTPDEIILSFKMVFLFNLTIKTMI